MGDKMKVLVALFMTVAVWAQQAPQSSIPFSTGAPTGVTTVNVNLTGNPGPNIYSYWVVAVLPQGQTQVSPAGITRNAPNTLTGSNFETITWTAKAGATSYTVIRTNGTTPFPGSCTGCVVATGVTGLSQVDNGGALTTFSYAPLGATTGSMRLNNDGVGATGFVFVPPITAGGGATIPATTNALKGDGAGNGAAVTGTGTNCVLVNGSSAACGTPGALTQVQVCSIETFGPAGDGVTNDAPAFTAANAACKEIQLTANKNYAITTPLTLTSSVNFVGGATMIANNTALTMNGEVIGPTLRLFTITGTGTVTIGGYTPDVYPEWFGALGNGAADDTIPVQQAYNSRPAFSGNLRLLNNYRTTSTVNFSTSFISVIGNSNQSSRITLDATTGNVIDVVGTGANCAGGSVLWQAFKNFQATRTAQATSGDGFNLLNTCYVSFFQVYSFNSITNLHLRGSGNTHITSGYFGWGTGTALTRNGIYLDSTGGGSNASTIIDGHTVSNGGALAGGTGLLVQGDCIADVFVSGFETALMDIGVHFNSTLGTSSSNCNSDIHLSKLIMDQIITSGITIENVNTTGTPSIEITDSHFQSSQGSGVVIINSTNVALTNNQFQVHGGGVHGIFEQGGNFTIINSNTFQQCDICIGLHAGSNFNTITGNTFRSGGGSSGITSTSYILLDTNIFFTIATGNVFGGAATTGITVSTGDAANQLWPNMFSNDGGIVAPYSVPAGLTGNIVNGPGYSIPTLGGSCPPALTALGTGSTNTAGSFVSNTTGTCVGALNFDFQVMGQPSNGWSCSFSLETASLTNHMEQNSNSRTSVIYQGVTTTGDTIHYSCQGF
jgi:hypothetical protein